MTTSSVDDSRVATPLSARVLLLGQDSVATLAARIRESRALEESSGWSALGHATRQLVDEQVATAAAGLVDVDLGQVVVAGWRKHEQLLAAASETAATPGQVAVVPLAAHTIAASWRPRVEVLVGNAPVAHVELQLAVAFTLTALSACVQDGRLTRLAGGPGRVTASLAMGGCVLAERTAGYDAQLAIPLGAGLRLLGAQATQRSAAELTSRAGTPAST